MDQLLRGLDANKAIRVVTAVTTDLVREGANRHGLSGAPALVLGRGLTAAALMTTLTKHDNERVRIAMQGDGPLGRMLIDAHGNGAVRGCFVSERVSRMNLPVEPGRQPMASFVGKGHIRVTRDVGLEQPYEGIADLHTSEIDEDLERYLTTSEQLPSTLRCHVVVDGSGAVVRAAGVLAQTFPGSGPERLDVVRTAVHDNGLADLLQQDRTTDDLMGFALGGEPFTPLAPGPLRFECNCGPARARTIVSTLGAEDIDALANEQDGTEVRCSYCGERYCLTGTELRELATELRHNRS